MPAEGEMRFSTREKAPTAPKQRAKRRNPAAFDLKLHAMLVDLAYEHIDPNMTGKAPKGLLDQIRTELLRLVRIVDADRRDYQRFITTRDKETVDEILSEERAALANSINLADNEDRDEDAESCSEDDRDLEGFVEDDVEETETKRIDYKPQRARISKAAPDPDTEEDEPDRYARLPLSSDDEVDTLTAALATRYGVKTSEPRALKTHKHASNTTGSKRRKKTPAEPRKKRTVRVQDDDDAQEEAAGLATPDDIFTPLDALD